MRYQDVHQHHKTHLLLLIVILLPLIQSLGCASPFHSTALTPADVNPASSPVQPAQHPYRDEMNVPGYLADSFRYDEADLVKGTCPKTAPHTPAYFWRELRNTSMARMKHDYITGLCLYSVGSEAHYKRGFLMDILGYNDLAILEYTLAIESNPQNDRYYNNRGSLYMLLDHPFRAVLDFTRAIEINPNRAEPYYNRARALEKMGRYDDAQRDYEKAVQLGICDTYPSLKICK